MNRSMIPIFALLILVFVPFSAQAQDAPLPALTGRIAYVGTDYNVYTLSGADSSRAMLTADAGPQENEIRVYQWPTWSTDGRLAYFGMGVNRNGQVEQTDVYVSSDGASAGDVVYSAEEQILTYAYWSPQNCAENANCRDLAVLLTTREAPGLLVELVRDGGAADSHQRVGVGSPFYYSWSPDGTRMIWQRNTDRIDIYDIETGDVIETLAQQPGFFAAPAWSPVDDRLLFGERSPDGSTTNLVIRANESLVTLAPELEGGVAFSWSPDGNYVAYTVDQSALFVVDAVTGESVARSAVNGVLSFFWSPDSTRIAFISVATPQGSFSADAGTGGVQAALAQGRPGIAWSVLDVETSAVRRYTTFIPTRDMLYLLQYFDQFSQSHRVWSPDSRYLLYSEVTPEGDPVITLLDVSGDDSVPLSIAEGFVGVWSFD